MIKLVIYGLGKMGQNHLRVCGNSPDYQVIGTFDPAKDSAGLNNKILMNADAFIIASPTETHLSVVRELAPMGKPILLEKPIADSISNAEKIIELGKLHQAAIRVGHLERLNPAVRALKDAIQSGKLGVPIHATFTRVGGYPELVSPSNNVVIDLAVHDLDVFRTLFGPAQITAALSHASYRPDIVDTAEILAKTSEGTTASFHVNWVTPTKVRTLRVTGTLGVGMVDYILQTCSIYGATTNQPAPLSDFQSLLQQYQQANHVELSIKKAEPLAIQLEQFANLIKGEPSSLCTSEEALDALKLAVHSLELAKHGNHHQHA